MCEHPTLRAENPRIESFEYDEWIDIVTDNYCEDCNILVETETLRYGRHGYE